MYRVFLTTIKEVGWAPMAVLAGHWIFAELIGHEPCVDPCMHFFGGAAMAYFLRRLFELSSVWIGAPSAFGLDLLAFGLSSFAALIWEFGEMGSDLFLGTNIQRSAPNTLRDLALGVSGAFLLLAGRKFFRASSKNPAPTASD